MIDMVGANATLASGGIRVTPYAAAEIRNSSGKVIYAHANDSGPPTYACFRRTRVAEMNNIMTHVVTEGTGRAAQIPGLVISGKTGTTNNSTNAWFNAFTGNLVGSVWFGNDDNTPMENMTGGTLPAMTWREIMVFAHQGLEPKPPFGVAPPPAARTRRRPARVPSDARSRRGAAAADRSLAARDEGDPRYRRSGAAGVEERPDLRGPGGDRGALNWRRRKCASASLALKRRQAPSLDFEPRARAYRRLLRRAASRGRFHQGLARLRD